MRIFQIFLVGCSVFAASAAIVVPGANGKDGVFAPNANVTIDLRQAVPGAWDDASLESGGNGVYDKDKWAIVFRYESVNIPVGVTVTFRNHYSGAPVVWLVSGDVMIAGTLSLSGENRRASGNYRFLRPGPGGFRGGAGAGSGIPGSAGFGIGGALYGWPQGSHAAVASPGGAAYGSAEITLLIGGSGSGGSSGGYFGRPGGGAILIAAAGTIEIPESGLLAANGGLDGGWLGSGGAIRLAALRVIGAGRIHAFGGATEKSAGRIRIEVMEQAEGELGMLPEPSFVLLQQATVRIFPELSSKTRIVSAGGVPAPLDPRAHLEMGMMRDVSVERTGPAVVLIETENFEPTDGTVTLYVTPWSGDRVVAQAALRPGGNFARAEWEATVDLQPGSYAMQVHALAQP